MFNTKRRLASAWAKGLMLGKAVGARDERDRIIALLENWNREEIWIKAAIQVIKGENK